MKCDDAAAGCDKSTLKGTVSGCVTRRFHTVSQTKIATTWVITFCDLCGTKSIIS